MAQHIKTSPQANRFKPLQPRYGRLLLVLAMGALLLVFNGLSGNFGVLGNDNDDLMRFMQIRDYLHGQNWFDTDQYRMGLTAAGTDMHWSRIPDIPIICLTHIFDLFMRQDAALDLAVSIWPPISAMIVFAAILIGADHIPFEGNRQHLRVFAGIIAAMFVMSNFRFESGSIDHHNLQFGFIALAMALAMDRDMRFGRYGLAGMATAISIAIGPEIYVFAAAICGFVALNWAVNGTVAARGTQGFGLGLAGGLSAIFIATIAPANYAVIYCDALSLITLTAGIFGGAGLAVIVQMGPYYGADKGYGPRFMALALLGVICLAVLSMQAPQCLANPLDSLPQDVQDLWLGYVSEAAPIYALEPDWPMFIPMSLGPVLLALLIIAHRHYQRFADSGFGAHLWSADVLAVMLLITALGLTIYQVRFAPFAYIFSILILARWIAQNYGTGLLKTGPNIRYIFCLALAFPILWAIPGAPFTNLQPTNVTQPDLAKINAQSGGAEAIKTDCGSGAVMEVFNTLPAGLIAANSNAAGGLLIHTPHRVISGNYHRNWAGISVEMKLSIASFEEARRILAEHEVDYYYFCKAKGMLRFKDYNPDGLTAQLYSGNIPDFLVQIHDAPLENGDALIFKVAY